ncbi:hypothetical protein [Gloeothece verrucosa]|uniref:Uncharacterized protein n=1 Tax=Gloeothece verrucosa (strain PCC 7822) TaxID=497965 RepID=E0U927_GLOV7|nr:hypothetical protein [Gloeothece verrucosa]ADN16166.1 hypothetical protein Cyan7822_4248 [Gloeothece verrucosa PCC 7822]
MKKSINPIRNPTSPSHQGFTIVEALVGITVAGLVFASTAPLILLAMATRLQSYRALQAMQIAQGEINRVQVLMSEGIKQDQETGQLPPPVASNVAITQVAAPTTSVKDATISAVDQSSKALEIDLDNNPNTTDDVFLVQTFRDAGIRFDQGTAVNQLAIFRMGVRVYSGLAKSNLGSLQTTPISLNVTQSLAQQRTRPLAVLYAEVSRSDLQFSLQKYKQYLNNN